MSRLSKHHEMLTNGEGKCSVPMWCGGLPAGFCDAPAYGRVEAGQRRYDGYVPALACHSHGGPAARRESPPPAAPEGASAPSNPTDGDQPLAASDSGVGKAVGTTDTTPASAEDEARVMQAITILIRVADAYLAGELADREEITRLREELADWEHLAALQRQREAPWIARWQQEVGQPDTGPDYGELLQWITEKAERAEQEATQLTQERDYARRNLANAELTCRDVQDKCDRLVAGIEQERDEALAMHTSEQHAHKAVEAMRRADDLRRETIEECAQLAEEDKAGNEKCDHCGCWDTADRIAAALRALAAPTPERLSQ